ncbi:MAG: hypothetical protein J6R22_02980 [Alphaproteobacteria bacterium]|nr:hypothetical protein [Alphaproteobacteria bacterium]
MQKIEHYNIGEKVFYFDPVREGELTVKESVVYGAFVHKQEGELYYFLEDKECPAYATSTTKEDIDEKIKAFIEYRDKLAEANKENKERFKALRSSFLFEEYTAAARTKACLQEHKKTLEDE